VHVSTQSLNCPNCGAPLQGAGGQSTVVCDHCGSVIALKPPSPAPGPGDRPAATPEPSSYEPRYEYGPVPQQQPARSDLTSLALGPVDAAHVLQLLHDKRELDAMLYYQSKTGGSLDEAKDAIRAIEAGLQDASASLTPGAASTAMDPATLPEVLRLTQSGQTIAAIKAYREATGVGLREAKARVEQLERQLAMGTPSPIMTAVPMPSPPAARSRSGALGCTFGCLGLVALFICIFGGCSAYVQTKAIYQCSLSAIKTAVAKNEIFAPPINAGYLVIVRNYNEAAGGNSYYLNMAYAAPVWGANGWGWVDAHVVVYGSGRNQVTATLHKGGQSQVLLPTQQINCAQ